MSVTAIVTPRAWVAARANRLVELAIRLSAVAMFALILLYFALAAPGFLSTFNLVNVIEQLTILGVLAFGMAVVIIGGGSDVQNRRHRPVDRRQRRALRGGLCDDDKRRISANSGRSRDAHDGDGHRRS
jgi:hypothetical protein